MPISDYLRGLRDKVGTDLLLTPAVSMICRNVDGGVLLARHNSPPGWALPGGSIDPGEIPADAAMREMWEETGLMVEPSRVVGIYGGPAFVVIYPNGDQICSVDIVFECRIVGGTLEADQDEVEALAFYRQEELDTLNLPIWTRIVLTDFFAGDSEQIPRTHFQSTTWKPPLDGVRHSGMSDYVRKLREKIGNDLLLMPAVGALICNEAGQILLQRRADNGRWGLPLGGMDPYETPGDAVVREVWEETGVVVEPIRLLGLYGGPSLRRTFANGHQVASIFYLFACRVIEGKPTADGVEAVAVAFVSFEEAKARLSDYWAERLDLLQGNSNEAWFQAATRPGNRCLD